MSSLSRADGSAHRDGWLGAFRPRAGSRVVGCALVWLLRLSVPLVAPSHVAAEPSWCADAIERAEVMVGDGAFEDARDLLQSCCDSLNSVERFDCLRVLLTSQMLLQERRQAIETARAMLALDPAARLAPGSATPRAVSLYDSLRTALVGGLSVQSEPTGADLHFDGEPLGQITPWRWYALQGEHEVRVSKEGYADEVLDVEVAAGVLELHTAILKRSSGRRGPLPRVELWRSTLVPGWGHVHSGRRRGWVYTASVLAAGVASVLSYGDYTSSIDDYNAAMDSRDRAGAAAAYDEIKKARGAWLTWAGVAAGVYVLNVVDAWLF